MEYLRPWVDDVNSRNAGPWRGGLGASEPDKKILVRGALSAGALMCQQEVRAWWLWHRGQMIRVGADRC